MTDATDFHTGLFRASRWRKADGARTCLYRANTIGKLVRGAMVADCLWLDVAENGDGVPAVDPTPAAPGGLKLDAALRVARSYGRALWVVNRLPGPGAGCGALAAALTADVGEQGAGGMVTFAPSLPWGEPGVRDCLGQLRSAGFTIAVELSAAALAACEGESETDAGRRSACNELVAILRLAEQSGVATGVAFDYRFVATMQKLGAGGELEWSAWNVPPAILESNALSRFHMVAVDAPPGPNDRSRNQVE